MSAAGPRVLVAVASRHGATEEIAAALARDLPGTAAGRALGLGAVLAPVGSRPDPAPFAAVLLGSAVYAGRWLEGARDYATAFSATLRARPVWLFSSGPIGPPPLPDDEPHDVAPIAALLGARGHRVFPGRLDPDRLSVGERAVVTAMRAPVGDVRDWALVRSWAEDVAAELAGRVPAVPSAGPAG